MYIRGTISFERPYRPSQVCYPVRRHNQHYPLHPTRKHYYDEAHIEYLTKKSLRSFTQMGPTGYPQFR